MEEALVLIHEMCCSIWAVNFLVFAYVPVALTAHVQHFAAVAISAQHFFASFSEVFTMLPFAYKAM